MRIPKADVDTVSRRVKHS